MNFQRIAASALVLALGLVCSARAEGLKLGDPVPKLEVKEFVKGDPVKGLEKGKVYVVEFWATWCPPCRTSIPHLTELQKKHKDAVFIGVSVDREQKAVKPFVEEMGDKMGYRVAIDDGAMMKSWFQAAGQRGIPSAFIVNKEGKLAWIGHPMNMEKPLDEILTGKYDLEAAISKSKVPAGTKDKEPEKKN